MISDCAFDLDPGTMRRSGDAAAFFRDLYETYNDELAALTAAMADMHRSMLANGYRADFSDRESELLYLLIRHFRPDTVVEMSPCHGYSTNYILAALTANQRGHVHSYEITTAVQGRPIEEVIRGNLLPSFDAGRMSLHIGDALKTVIPSCDLAFIDSNHEAWFAASYLQHVVPRARLCLTQDIVVRHRSGLIPKTVFTGVREAAQVPQSLAENGQRCIAVAGLDLPSGFTSRQSAPERSLIYAGHPQSARALATQQTQQRVAEIAHMIIAGDRDVAVDEARHLVLRSGSFATLCVGVLFAALGHRIEEVRAHFPEAHEALLSALHAEPFTVSTYNAALDLGSRLRAPSLVAAAHRRAKASSISEATVAALFSGYRAESYSLPQWVARIAERITP
jgi:predicted O-methyltransferase YrrM